MRDTLANTMNFVPCNGTEPKLANICRCCLGKECFLDISTEYYDSGKKVVYQEMLKDVFNIQTSPAISVKQYICGECVEKLRDASTFKKMVTHNEQLYLECLQSYQSGNDADVPDSALKVEHIKLEVPLDEMDFGNTCSDDPDYSFDDNEIVDNLKFEANSIQKSVKERTSSSKKKYKSKCSIQEREVEKPTHLQGLSKLSERRGSGPILRENSLKLLANSTATVFQWNKSRYRCFCCNEPYSDISLLRTHTEKQHTLEDIQKKIIIQQNRLVKVEISSLNCKICNEKLNNLEDLKVHLHIHCILVDDHLLVPFRIETKLNCQICLEPFSLFRLLNIHINKHYQKHVCHVCGAGFSNLVFLNLHRTRSHRPIRCQKCDTTFLSRTEKKQHDTEVHGVKFERKHRFPCPYCPERFYQENLRVKHLVDKHGVKKPEFSCQFCSKTFLTRSLLNNHVKVVHMKEKNHECDVCHHFFYTKSDVSRHRVTHTGEKNFCCSLCNNPFASRDSLRRHMKRTHACK